jgi:CheY-like chemotaxis protein
MLLNLSGHEARVAHTGPDGVAAAITGYGQDSDVERSKEAGIDHHFLKPIDPCQLRQLLANAKKQE